MNKAIEWSIYQLAIFRWVIFGEGHAAIEATAGAGKTTVLVEVARRICEAKRQSRILYLTFNKRLQEEAEEKFALLGDQVVVRTLHSQGRAQLRHVYAKTGRPQPKVDPRKSYKLAREIIKARIPQRAWRTSASLEPERAAKLNSPLINWLLAVYPKRQAHHLARMMRDHLNIIKVRCVGAPTPEVFTKILMELAKTYGLTLPRGSDAQEEFGLYVLDLYQQSLWASKGQIDFGDMLFVPGFLGLEPDANYDWVLVDEAQDLSPAALKLLETLVWPAPYNNGTRLLAVGDPNQAIYGFAGADTRSFERVIERYQATRLPLTVSYRCPELHVRLCQRLVAHMQARPGVSRGQLTSCGQDVFYDLAQVGDLVIARCNAPLITACLRLLSKGIPAIVRGRDVSKLLLGFARTAHDCHPSVALSLALKLHQEQLISSLQEAIPEIDADDPRLLQIRDTRDSIEVILNVLCLPASTSVDAQLDALAARLAEIFKERNDAVWLSTVHRAKGLESQRVFVIHPHELPMIWSGQSVEERRQELCAVFVAASRAKISLCVVHGDLSGRSIKRTDPFWSFEALLVANDLPEVLEMEAQNTDAPANDDVGRYSFEAPGHVP